MTTKSKRAARKEESTSAASDTKRQVRKAAKAPRDLKTEDNGVPRGDWSDDPLKPDDGGEGIRSNFDDHYESETPSDKPDTGSGTRGK